MAHLSWRHLLCCVGGQANTILETKAFFNAERLRKTSLKIINPCRGFKQVNAPTWWSAVSAPIQGQVYRISSIKEFVKFVSFQKMGCGEAPWWWQPRWIWRDTGLCSWVTKELGSCLTASRDKASGLRSRTGGNKHSIMHWFSLRELVTVIHHQTLHYVPGQIQREHLGRWMSNGIQQNTH